VFAENEMEKLKRENESLKKKRAEMDRLLKNFEREKVIVGMIDFEGKF
jgi:hypothetical protein